MTNVSHLTLKQKNLSYFALSAPTECLTQTSLAPIYIFQNSQYCRGWYEKWLVAFFLILSAMLTDILLTHYREWRNLSRFFYAVPSVSLSVKPGLAGHADYLCDLHCYSHSLALFCSPFWVFTLVHIHNEYRRSCNINEPQSLGRWVYLRIQIMRTVEVTGSLHVRMWM